MSLVERMPGEQWEGRDWKPSEMLTGTGRLRKRSLEERVQLRADQSEDVPEVPKETRKGKRCGKKEGERGRGGGCTSGECRDRTMGLVVLKGPLGVSRKKE